MEAFDLLLVKLAGLMVVVWGGAESMGRYAPWAKLWTALLLGVTGTVILHGNGYLICGEGPWGYANAAFLGLIAALSAAKSRDVGKELKGANGRV